ncbi:rRNA maturation RNase YbeY [Candidatus Wolfebacteria bacterium]|nr:MAG: rRNA maturation RNase YbeY [Candidatus Wolfebacteria bacterium]
MVSYTGNNVSVRRLTNGKLPSLPFTRLKEAVLGKKYDLSIVFVGSKMSQEINKKYRKKNKPTNILSFVLSEESGELVISLGQVRKDAPNFNKSYLDFLGFLIIHGLLHLKGYDHGKEMELLESKFSRKFGF